jgi:multiple sugar transport system permease protein
VILTFVAYLAAFLILFPVLWIILASFRDPDNFLSLNVWDNLPRTFSLDSYRMALGRSDLLRWIGNSLFVATSTAVVSLLVSAPAAYAIARLRFRGKSVFDLSTLVSYAIPSILIVVPMYVLLVRLGLYNSYLGLITVHATFTIPFSTWVLRDFFRSIPPDLEEAGFVDGASIPRVLRYIVLPLSIPGLLAAAAYSFILSWNDLLFALVIMGDTKSYTASVGVLSYFTGTNITQSTWAQLMAASALVCLPSAILFGFFQRYLVSGFLSGAVKG